jgi:hypothetical protein
MSGQVFHEVQKLRQWHIRIVLALPPAALLFITIRQVVFHHPWGAHPISNGDLIFLTILLAAVYLRLITVRMVTDIDAGELAIGLRGLWRRRRIPLSAIRSAKSAEYNPLDYGGYGIKSGPLGLAYIADGNRAVQVELNDGRKLLIGSQRAEELARAIQRPASRR